MPGTCCPRRKLWTLKAPGNVQVHSRHKNFPSFGDGDLGEAGIRKFFSTHRCNRICKDSKLRRVSDYDFLPPREIVRFPGCSDDFLHELTITTLKKMRKKFNLAELLLSLVCCGQSCRYGVIRPFICYAFWREVPCSGYCLPQ